MKLDQLREMALAFPEVTEEPHFEKISFRVKKKIFATYDERLKRVSVKLSEVDQSVFCSGDQTFIFPVVIKWGKQGWTLIEMEEVHQALFKYVLKAAYCTVAPQKLGDLVKPYNL